MPFSQPGGPPPESCSSTENRLATPTVPSDLAVLNAHGVGNLDLRGTAGRAITEKLPLCVPGRSYRSSAHPPALSFLRITMRLIEFEVHVAA